MSDIWVTIKTHENYVITKDGKVKNLITGRVLKHSMSGNGYFTVYVDRVNCLLHRLLAETFIPNPENKPCINHKDGNKQNNNLDNLEWCDKKENNLHAVKTGLRHYNHRFGEKSSNHKLTQKDVDYIRKYYGKPLKGRQLAKKFGVTDSCISSIINNRNWRVS